MSGLGSWTVISKYALATEMHKLDWSPASACPRFLGGDKCFNLFLWSPMHHCSSCPSRALNAPLDLWILIDQSQWHLPCTHWDRLIISIDLSWICSLLLSISEKWNYTQVHITSRLRWLLHLQVDPKQEMRRKGCSSPASWGWIDCLLL